MDGTYFVQNWFYESNRLQTPYLKNYCYLHQNPLFPVPGLAKKPVLTDIKLHSFQKWFEEHFKKTSKRIINATQEGVWIPHTASIPFDVVVAQEGRPIDKKTILDQYQDQEFASHQEKLSVFKNVKKAFVMVDQQFKNLMQKAQEGLKLSRKWGQISESLGSCSAQIAKIQGRIRQLDQQITADPLLNGLISLSMQSVIQTLDSEGKSEAHRSLILYTGIVEGIRFNLQELNKAVQMLDQHIHNQHVHSGFQTSQR